jgi:hypothetical protein
VREKKSYNEKERGLIEKRDKEKARAENVWEREERTKRDR